MPGRSENREAAPYSAKRSESSSAAASALMILYWSDFELLAAFERVVRLAPNFARGWEYLAIGRSVAAASTETSPAAVSKARAAIAGARRLNPDSGLAYFAEALLIMRRSHSGTSTSGKRGKPRP